MPASLRFVLALLAAAALLALVSGVVLTRQSQSAARINAEQIARGDSAAGKRAIQSFGCSACHDIPGIPNARGAVGPSLDGIAERAQLAGKLANTPENLIRWVQAPQSISPNNGMPNLGVNEIQGRDIAAYLYTLRKSRPNK